MTCINEHRLYRGQPKEYDDYPLAPTALREGCIKNMENLLSKHKIRTRRYKRKCRNFDIKSQQYDCCASEAFYAFWLSLVRCIFAINTYISPEHPYKFQFFSCPPQYKNGKRIPLYKNGKFYYHYKENGKVIPMGMRDVTSPEEIAAGCFEFSESFFNPNSLIEPLQWILPDYALFQHFNFVMSEPYKKRYNETFGEMKNKNTKIVFPTLLLDWTWCKEKAREFANQDGKEGTILSISFEKYREWSQKGRNPMVEIKGLCDEQGHPLPPQNSRTPIFGMETYRNTDNWDDKQPIQWGSENNTWMIEQKGAVIFWPWKYSIDQLRSNDLGKAFDFRVEK